jgi:hypothetical protein
VASQAALEIILEARDEASKVLGGLSGSLGSLGGVAGAVATGGLALAGAAVAGIGAGAVVAGKQVLDFTADTNEAMRNFQAQVGASEEEMAGFREQALDVFESGYGESVGDISGAMAGVNQVLGETGDQLEESTRRALILRDTFELDVQEGVSIAAAAVKSGLAENSEEAFDLITKGFQEGLNQAGDFGDTIREYSSDFERLGFTTQEVLGVLNAGLEEGAYNTDVVADGIREFGIRFGAAEESALTALDAIGINSEELYAKYQAGEITVADAMATITGALGQVDNKTLQAQAGAALFGSKWEDVGGDVFMAAGQAQGAVEDLSGATDQAGQTMEEGLRQALERLYRTALTNLEPLGQTVAETLNKATPYVEKATKWIGEKLPEGIEWLGRKWNEVFPKARDTAVNFYQRIQPGLEWIEAQSNDFSDNILPHLESAWGSLQVGWEMIVTVWRRDLKPALGSLADALGLGSGALDEIGGATGDWIGYIISTNVKGVILGVVGAIKVLKGIVDGATWLINNFKRGLEGVAGAADWVRSRINDLKSAMSSGWEWVPDWLIPGSPTPFEMGLRGIGDAMDALPDLSAQFTVNGGGMPLAAAGAGGGTYVIHNHFGAGSVRSQDDIEEIGRKQEEILEIRGVRAWDV